MPIRITYGYDGTDAGSFEHARKPRLDDLLPFHSFGDVSVTHGYSRSGESFSGFSGFSGAAFGRYGDFAVDAPGRSPGDDYSAAPYFIPLDVDVQTDPTALVALSLGISYAAAQNTSASMAAVVNDTNNAVAMWAAKLSAAMAKNPGASDSLKSDAANWLQTSSMFQDLGNQMVAGTADASRFPAWKQLGLKLEAQANDLAGTLGLPVLTLSGALAPPGFGKALGLLKLLLYGGIAIAALYFGAEVAKTIGIFGKVKSYAGHSRRGR